MQRGRVPITRFNAGVLSPLLDGAIDLQWYPHGVRESRNMIVLPHGPAKCRSGTRFVAEAKHSDRLARLLRHQFNEDQPYILEWGDFYFRVFKDRGRLENPPGTPVEVATIYPEADLANLQEAQRKDLLYTANQAHPTQVVTRASDVDWSIAPVDFFDGPYLAQNLTTTSITASGVTGAVTLTSSQDLFEPGHVGALWRLSEASGSLPFIAWAAGQAKTAGAKVRSDGKVYEATTSATTGDIAPVHDRPDEVFSDGGVSWKYLHDGNGHVVITSITSPTEAAATVKSRLPDSATSGTTRWSEGAWSPKNGYPGAISFYERRLFLAGSVFDPDVLDGSKNFQPEVFSPGDLADDALRLVAGAEQLNAILWLIAGERLTAGTSDGPWEVKSSGFDEPLTPDKSQIKQQDDVRAVRIKPVRLGGSILFVGANGRAIYRLVKVVTDEGTERLSARSISRKAEHLTKVGIVDIAASQDPWPILWVVLADGRLLGCTYVPEEAIEGWHVHELADSRGGPAFVESVATKPGPRGDELWLLVRRVVGGVTKRFIEVMEDDFEDQVNQTDAYFVDCGLTFSAWNTDPARTLTLTADTPGKWAAEATGVLTATGWEPFAPGDADKVWQIAMGGDLAYLQIVQVNGLDQVAVRFVRKIPRRLRNNPTSEWLDPDDRVTKVTGAGHLEGEEAQLFVDGATHPERTVVNGEVDLDGPAGKVHLGLGFPALIQPMRLQLATAEGASEGRQQRSDRVAYNLYRSGKPQVVRAEDDLEILPIRDFSDIMDIPPEFFTGIETAPLPGGYSPDPQMVFVQPDPVSFTLRGLSPRLGVGNR